mmetsp:Transcript_1927/g.6164  ORF Transcript_1927/g.6164 Transcript_1927/m.6164 type:complete len:124 (-) Transcript_1927:134-505(-)
MAWQAALAFVDSSTLSTVALGMLDSEATSAAPQTTSLLQEFSGPTDDSASYDEVTSSNAFQAKLAKTCEGLESVHPGCRTVARDLLYCQALGQAAMALVDTARLADKMAEIFSANPSFVRHRS